MLDVIKWCLVNMKLIEELHEVILVAEVATPEGRLLGTSTPSIKRNLIGNQLLEKPDSTHIGGFKM